MTDIQPIKFLFKKILIDKGLLSFSKILSVFIFDKIMLQWVK